MPALSAEIVGTWEPKKLDADQAPTQEIHVSTAGDDRSGNGTPSSPYASITRAVEDAGINADDGGDYADPDTTRHVVFRNLEISDIGASGNHDCLKLSGVDDFVVADSYFARCGGGSLGSGIDLVGCHGGQVQGNTFESMSGNAVQTKGGSENIRIHGNTIVNGGYRALNIGGSTGLQYFRPPISVSSPNFEARKILVTSNVIIGSQVPLAFVGAVDSVVANNTIIRPTRWLIRILQETKSDGPHVFRPSGNNAVIGNLFYFNRSALKKHIDIRSNVDATSFVFANNLWFAYDDADGSRPHLPVPESGAITGKDPLLVAPESGDFRLRSNSPAISAGQPLKELAEDHLGTKYEDPPSIGAFETSL